MIMQELNSVLQNIVWFLPLDLIKFAMKATVIKYLREKEKRKDFPRILQFSSEDRMTKYEICQKLAQVMGVAIPGMIPNKQGNDPNGGVMRPYDTHLSTKALTELGIDVRTVDFIAWW